MVVFYVSHFAASVVVVVVVLVMAVGSRLQSWHRSEVKKQNVRGLVQKDRSRPSCTVVAASRVPRAIHSAAGGIAACWMGPVKIFRLSRIVGRFLVDKFFCQPLQQV